MHKYSKSAIPDKYIFKKIHTKYTIFHSYNVYFTHKYIYLQPNKHKILIQSDGKYQNKSIGGVHHP